MRKASLHPPAASDGNGFSVGGCGKEDQTWIAVTSTAMTQ
jgi:hypothetical protein